MNTEPDVILYLLLTVICAGFLAVLVFLRDISAALQRKRIAKDYVYLPPVVSHQACCRGAEVQHAAISAAPVAFEDGHACADCCPCPDCGLVRAEQFDTDPTAWEGFGRAGWIRAT